MAERFDGGAGVNSSASALFLHGGPGLSCGIERLWFEHTLPICWWDQPQIVNDRAAPFSQLVDAAMDKLRGMEDEAGGPIALVAHSFGVQIALALVRKAPEQVKELTILASGPNPLSSLFRLCRRLTEIQSSPELEAAIANAEKHLDPQSFKSMVLLAASHPAYPAVYFGPDAAARDRYLSYLPQTRPLDLETFLNVMGDFLRSPDVEPIDSFHGQVTVVFGCHDPLLPVEETFKDWKRIFPRVQTEVINSAHFIHLEAPPESWFQETFRHVA